MSDALLPILAAKRTLVAERKRQHPLPELERIAAAALPPRGFAQALRRVGSVGKLALIAEMKRKSPSGGEIRPGFDPAIVARAYQDGGAACLSVLTDEPYFGGLDTDLAAARGACTLPVLRKDFVVDAYQVVESRALGADCILLIVAALTNSEIREFAALAASLGMDALVEVHDEAELDRALALDAQLIGINNRNLKTLTTDLTTFELLAAQVPKGALLVAESGLKTHADLRRMANAGAHGYLVGESLLRETDLSGATRKLLLG